MGKYYESIEIYYDFYLSIYFYWKGLDFLSFLLFLKVLCEDKRDIAESDSIDALVF